MVRDLKPVSGTIISEPEPVAHGVEVKQVALERLDASARRLNRRFRASYVALTLIGVVCTAVSPTYFAASLGFLMATLLIYRWRLERYEEQRRCALVETAAPAFCDCTSDMRNNAWELGTRPVSVGLCPICHNTRR